MALVWKKIYFLSFKKILSKRIIIFSRDESKQYEMQNDSSFKKYKKALRFFIGDVKSGKIKISHEGS